MPGYCYTLTRPGWQVGLLQQTLEIPRATPCQTQALTALAKCESHNDLSTMFRGQPNCHLPPLRGDSRAPIPVELPCCRYCRLVRQQVKSVAPHTRLAAGPNDMYLSIPPRIQLVK